MQITIHGKVISKKNSKQVGVNKYTHQVYVSTSSAWKAFREEALWQLKEYRRQGCFTGKVRIDYQFFFKGKQWLDFDNAIAGINDLLEESTIISNDRDIKKGSFEVFEDCAEWVTQLTIENV